MNTVFADTHYWLAVSNPHDQWAEAARKATTSLGQVLLVTTDEVLTEFLTAMSKSGPVLRQNAVRMARAIMENPTIRVIQQSRDTFLQAMDRYEKRKDKSYSLTDCSSMNAMDAERITEVLTNDHHFQQEGYRVLITR